MFFSFLENEMSRILMSIPFVFFIGSVLGSFIILFGVLTVYGSYLIYGDIRETGCDPVSAPTLTNRSSLI